MKASSADTRTYSAPERKPLRTKLTREQLQTNARALGFDPNDKAALMCCAMISDQEFGEQIVRLNFEKAMREVRL
jgi:hypothetical protein